MQELLNTIQQNPVFLFVFSVYTATLKGLSLWKAARNSHKYWFIGLLVINLLGIPELLYIFYFSKKKFSLPVKTLHKESSKK